MISDRCIGVESGSVEGLLAGRRERSGLLLELLLLLQKSRVKLLLLLRETLTSSGLLNESLTLLDQGIGLLQESSIDLTRLGLTLEDLLEIGVDTLRLLGSLKESGVNLLLGKGSLGSGELLLLGNGGLSSFGELSSLLERRRKGEVLQVGSSVTGS